MNIDDITFALVDALEATHGNYLLVGAIASIHYGIMRSTFDVDAVVAIEQRGVVQLARKLGPRYQLEPQQAFEVFTGKHLHVIHVTGTPFKIDLFPLTDEPFDQERFRRRVRAKLLGREVWLPTAEDVLVQKLRWGRPKDLDDARDVMAVQQESLDWKYIENWCRTYGTYDILIGLRDAIPPA
jgi:hypothetical protein